MRDSFMTQFYKKSEKSRKLSVLCYKNADYIGFLDAWIEDIYYEKLGYVLSGHDPKKCLDVNGKIVTLIEGLRIHFEIGIKRKNYASFSIKKLGKEDKISELQIVIDAFINEIAPDFIEMEKRTDLIAKKLMNMSTWERIEKGLTSSVDNSIDPYDKLMLEDAEFMAILNKRKSKNNITKLVNQFHEILN